MNDIAAILANADWESIRASLNEKGYAIVPRVLSAADCRKLIACYDDPALYRKTIVMERYRFGLGAYKYFQYPLPPLIQSVRDQVYPHIAPVANTWMEALKLDTRFPYTLEGLQELCRQQGQVKPTVLILKYGAGGHNTLHQDLYGDVFFPMQLVLFLNEPGKDYTGGEFVLTEQVPRAQSKAIVLQPGRGDMLLFTTNFRPVKGSKGYYRVHMKHGVSPVQDGVRHTLGIIFHDALS
jgi:uncharacterized protein